MNNKQNDLNTLVLAALLHDIGKFYLGENLCDEFKNVRLKGHGHAKWSACFVRKYEKIMPNVAELIDMILYHGQPDKELDYNGVVRDENKVLRAQIISVADKLSSKERREEGETESEAEEKKEKTERSEIPLLSVFNEISLGLNNGKNKQKAYSLNPLGISRDILFPRYPDSKLQPDAYKTSWIKINRDFESIVIIDPITLFYILYKYTWCAPSATPVVGVKPDVSLFDHARTTAAIASALYKNYKLWTNNYATKLNAALRESVKKKSALSQTYQKLLKEALFVLLAADIFGIQNFIYTSSNIPGTSKRLRGRSFYLQLLPEIVARYIIYHPDIGLSPINIIYCAGGNFQILLPKTEEIISKLNKICREINKELYKVFKGKIGFVFAEEEVSPSDFDAWDSVLKRINDKINLKKKEKMSELLKENEEEVFLFRDEFQERKDICASCGDTIPYPEKEEEKVCKFCEEHRKIGEILPKTEAVIFHQGSGKITSKNEKEVEVYEIDFGTFGKATLIKRKVNSHERLQLKVDGSISNLEYYKLNDTENFINMVEIENGQPSFGFKFLGNVVPLEDDGSVMEYEKIAEKSEGAKKLGILKMDVDHLSLVLQIGLSSKEPSDRTISRLATLSRMIELYFSGYIHKICEEFKYTYIIYSGGDDLLIVGPWSEIPALAKRIYDGFREYTCENEDITLSAGIFVCDPKFPVKRFALLVDEELKASKRKKLKNSCTFFGETVHWLKRNEEISFKELIDFGEELYNYLAKKKIARGFLHELLEMHYLYFSNSIRNKSLYLPRLTWQITRNVRDKDTKEKLFVKSIKWLENIKIPVSYALLKSRR